MPESYPLTELIRFWQYSLQARNLSERTVTLYTEAAHQFVAFLETEGLSTEPARG